MTEHVKLNYRELQAFVKSYTMDTSYNCVLDRPNTNTNDRYSKLCSDVRSSYESPATTHASDSDKECDKCSDYVLEAKKREVSEKGEKVTTNTESNYQDPEINKVKKCTKIVEERNESHIGQFDGINDENNTNTNGIVSTNQKFSEKMTEHISEGETFTADIDLISRIGSKSGVDENINMRQSDMCNMETSEIMSRNKTPESVTVSKEDESVKDKTILGKELPKCFVDIEKIGEEHMLILDKEKKSDFNESSSTTVIENTACNCKVTSFNIENILSKASNGKPVLVGSDSVSLECENMNCSDINEDIVNKNTEKDVIDRDGESKDTSRELFQSDNESCANLTNINKGNVGQDKTSVENKNSNEGDEIGKTEPSAGSDDKTDDTDCENRDMMEDFFQNSGNDGKENGKSMDINVDRIHRYKNDEKTIISNQEKHFERKDEEVKSSSVNKSVYEKDKTDENDITLDDDCLKGEKIILIKTNEIIDKTNRCSNDKVSNKDLKSVSAEKDSENAELLREDINHEGNGRIGEFHLQKCYIMLDKVSVDNINFTKMVGLQAGSVKLCEEGSNNEDKDENRMKKNDRKREIKDNIDKVSNKSKPSSNKSEKIVKDKSNIAKEDSDEIVSSGKSKLLRKSSSGIVSKNKSKACRNELIDGSPRSKRLKLDKSNSEKCLEGKTKRNLLENLQLHKCAQNSKIKKSRCETNFPKNKIATDGSSHVLSEHVKHQQPSSFREKARKRRASFEKESYQYLDNKACHVDLVRIDSKDIGKGIGVVNDRADKGKLSEGQECTFPTSTCEMENKGEEEILLGKNKEPKKGKVGKDVGDGYLLDSQRLNLSMPILIGKANLKPKQTTVKTRRLSAKSGLLSVKTGQLSPDIMSCYIRLIRCDHLPENCLNSDDECYTKVKKRRMKGNGALNSDITTSVFGQEQGKALNEARYSPISVTFETEEIDVLQSGTSDGINLIETCLNILDNDLESLEDRFSKIRPSTRNLDDVDYNLESVESKLLIPKDIKLQKCAVKLKRMRQNSSFSEKDYNRHTSKSPKELKTSFSEKINKQHKSVKGPQFQNTSEVKLRCSEKFNEQLHRDTSQNTSSEYFGTLNNPSDKSLIGNSRGKYPEQQPDTLLSVREMKQAIPVEKYCSVQLERINVQTDGVCCESEFRSESKEKEMTNASKSKSSEVIKSSDSRAFSRLKRRSDEKDSIISGTGNEDSRPSSKTRKNKWKKTDIDKGNEHLSQEKGLDMNGTEKTDHNTRQKVGKNKNKKKVTNKHLIQKSVDSKNGKEDTELCSVQENENKVSRKKGLNKEEEIKECFRQESERNALGQKSKVDQSEKDDIESDSLEEANESKDIGKEDGDKNSDIEIFSDYEHEEEKKKSKQKSDGNGRNWSKEDTMQEYKKNENNRKKTFKVSVHENEKKSIDKQKEDGSRHKGENDKVTQVVENNKNFEEELDEDYRQEDENDTNNERMTDGGFEQEGGKHVKEMPNMVSQIDGNSVELFQASVDEPVANINMENNTHGAKDDLMSEIDGTSTGSAAVNLNSSDRHLSEILTPKKWNLKQCYVNIEELCISKNQDRSQKEHEGMKL